MADQENGKENLLNKLQKLSKEHDALKTSFEKDMTDHKRATEALTISENRYRRLFETAKDGILILDAETGKIMDVNPFLIELLGYSKEQFIEKEIWEIGFFKDIAANKDKFFELQMKEYVRYEDLPLETTHGRKINVEFVSNVYSVNSHKVIQCNIRNITERRRTEEALKKSEGEFRLLAEAMPQIVWITRPDGWNIYFNQHWVSYTGQTLEESYGHGWNKPFHPDDQQRAWDTWQKATINGTTYSLECRLRRIDGVYKWWLIRGVPVMDEHGTILKWFGTCTDIDELKNSEEELIVAKEHAEQSDRLKSSFLANMSHEIRTPMYGILGFAGLLKEPELTGEQQEKYIGIIEKSGARLLNIINDIISFSKIESGQMETVISETNINDQIEYIYTFFKREAELKGIKIFFNNSLPVKEATVKTDREKIYAILTNLVKNAIKFTHAGSIELGYGKKGQYLEFFVKDTGEGISQEQKEIIFERFMQGSDSLSRNYEGAGLGLSISKGYVEMLGGRIWVDSELGKGSIFYFTIPYNPEQEKNISKNLVSVDGDEDQIKNLKILIAEDDETSEMLIAMVIKVFGKEVLNARTGVEAVEICRNNPDIDLILMDIKMPDMDGYTATRQIRQFNKEVVIIAQTAFGLTGDREKAIDAGCNDYIPKPFTKVALMDLLDKTLKNKVHHSIK